jgi:hypothetical protein
MRLGIERTHPHDCLEDKNYELAKSLARRAVMGGDEGDPASGSGSRHGGQAGHRR